MKHWVDHSGSSDGHAKWVCDCELLYEFSVESFLDHKGHIYFFKRSGLKDLAKHVPPIPIYLLKTLNRIAPFFVVRFFFQLRNWSYTYEKMGGIWRHSLWKIIEIRNNTWCLLEISWLSKCSFFKDKQNRRIYRREWKQW